MNRTLLAALVTLVWAQAGCLAQLATTLVANPLRTGAALSPSTLTLIDTERARYFGVSENYFVQEASLLQLTPESVCFGLTLRIDGYRAQLAVLDSWRVFLRMKPDLELQGPVWGPAQQPTETTTYATVPEEQFVGYFTSCVPVARMMQCSQQPRYMTVRTPITLRVFTATRAVCFVHAGAVNRDTRELTLHLDDPGNLGHRLAFRWRFTQGP